MNNGVTEATRRAYLKALGVDVYALRANEASDASGVGVSSEDAIGEPLAEHLAAPMAEHMDWDDLRQKVSVCTRCTLHKSRKQTVFGVGDRSANWMIIGEAPGAEEDRRGEPFVGRAGKLLDEMIRALGLTRDSVFISNILKCRPPNNRDPSSEEAEMCRSFLQQQIAWVAPEMILAVGRIAAQHLLNTDAPLGRMRQQKHYLADGQYPVVVTYHPAYLLRSPTQKRKSWQDLCFARKWMDENRK